MREGGSEAEPQAHLDAPAVVCLADYAGCDIGDVHVGRPKIRVIQNIEELTAILQAEPFVDREILKYREIQIAKWRRNYHVTSSITLKSG